MEAWALAHPYCFTVLAFPVVIVGSYLGFKVVKAILTDSW